MSSSRGIGMFERLANMFGVIYRYHAREFPRRYAILKDVMKKELAPPKPSDWPVIKKEFSGVIQVLKSGTYKQYTVREAMVYVAVGLEIIFAFFIGEMIGRRNICGYIIPYNYVSKSAKKKLKHMEVKEPTAL